MDKNFYDLLARYVKGNCTEDEIKKISRWYEEMGSNDLQLDEEEKKLIKARVLENIRRVLSAQHKPLGKCFYLFAFVEIVATVGVCGLWFFADRDFLPDNRLAKNPELPGEVIIENQADDNRVCAFPDGSTVQLASSGEIHFSSNFSAGKREVCLTGEGFFDIVKDSVDMLYVIHNSIVSTYEVKGTRIQVNGEGCK